MLQLTEAEKVSRALGMNESAQRIRAMMQELAASSRDIRALVRETLQRRGTTDAVL